MKKQDWYDIMDNASKSLKTLLVSEVADQITTDRGEFHYHGKDYTISVVMSPASQFFMFDSKNSTTVEFLGTLEGKYKRMRFKVTTKESEVLATLIKEKFLKLIKEMDKLCIIRKERAENLKRCCTELTLQEKINLIIENMDEGEKESIIEDYLRSLTDEDFKNDYQNYYS